MDVDLRSTNEELLRWYQVSEYGQSVWLYVDGKLVRGKVMGKNKKERLVKVRQWQLYCDSSVAFELWLKPEEVWKYKKYALAAKKE